jgi:polyhydroxybutyrate depolymerase
MRNVLGSVLVGTTCVLAAGCSGETPGTTPGAAGTSVSSGGGGGSSGGSAGAGGSTVSAGTGGSAGTSGSAGTGGTTENPTSGSAGVGDSGGSGGGGSGHVAVPSAGCGKLNPVDGAREITTGGQTATFNVNLPDDYDAMTPMPLGFGFHGFGNDECGPDQGECRGFAMLPAVTVYMKSISDGWEQSEVREQNITFWQDVLALMKDEYCIDQSRVFIAGVSSGGQFIEHLTCRFGDTLWQTTAVSAGAVQLQDCLGTPPVLVIHGVTDQAGGYGEDTAAIFAERNGCSETPPAELEQAKTDLMEAFNQQQAEHVCMDWDACTLAPVRFCLSSQITYDGLTHGWPMIGGQLIGEFQDTLPTTP